MFSFYTTGHLSIYIIVRLFLETICIYKKVPSGVSQRAQENENEFNYITITLLSLSVGKMVSFGRFPLFRFENFNR